MRVRIQIDLAGRLTVFVDEGATFEEAAAVSEKLLAAIGTVAQLTAVGAPEQHRHDGTDALLHSEVGHGN